MGWTYDFKANVALVSRREKHLSDPAHTWYCSLHILLYKSLFILIQDEPVVSTSSYIPPTKAPKTRSTTSLRVATNVLPKVCVLCKKASKKKAGTTQREALRQAETIGGGESSQA